MERGVTAGGVEGSVDWMGPVAWALLVSDMMDFELKPLMMGGGVVRRGGATPPC